MKHSKSELYFLLTLLIGVLLLVFFVFRPFLYPLIIATVFATVFGGLHRRILRDINGRAGLAALVATIIVLIIVIVPLTLLGVQIFHEASNLYWRVATLGDTFDLSGGLQGALDKLQRLSPVPIELDVNQYARQALNWVTGHLGVIFSNIASTGLAIFVFLVALYYLFKDGRKLKEALIVLSPLQDVHDKMIFEKLGMAVHSVVRGSITIALIQGTLSAIGFAIFGVPNPVLWGGVTAIAAFIPGIGTALVLTPAILYLFFTGTLPAAIGLLIWGMVAVGLIDNFLGPRIVGNGVRLHPLLALLSILGGVSLFGPLGLLLGPITLSLLFALLDIYSSIYREHTAA